MNSTSYLRGSVPSRMLDLLFVCPERRGTRIRRVVEVEASIELEYYLRRKLPANHSPFKDVSTIWSDGVRVFLVDGVGMMMKGPFDYEGLPDAHIAFWDKVLVGREAMARSMAAKIAEGAGSKGVFTAMPKESRATLAFAKRIGFDIIRETDQVFVLTLLFT